MQAYVDLFIGSGCTGRGRVDTLDPLSFVKKKVLVAQKKSGDCNACFKNERYHKLL
jgi:hypothetical protein